MNFGQERWLLGLWALPVVACLFAWAFHRQRSAARLMAGGALAPLLTSAISWGRRRLKAALIVGAAALGIFGALVMILLGAFYNATGRLQIEVEEVSAQAEVPAPLKESTTPAQH